MANPKVKILRSSVAGKRPGVDNMELGELALNTNDGQLFAKRDTGGVGIATTVTLLTPWQEAYEGGTIEYSGNANVTGVLSATTFIGDGSSLTNIISGVGIQSGAVRVGTGFTDLKFVGSAVSTIVGLGNTVTINISPVETSITRQVATASGITTDFTISGGYTAGFIDVYLNGVKQRSGTDFTATDESTVTMSPYVNDGDVLEFQIYKNLSMGAMYDGTTGQLLQHNGSTYVGISSEAYSDFVTDCSQGYYAYTTDYYTVGVANTVQELVEDTWNLLQPQVAATYNHQTHQMQAANSGNPYIGAGATIGTGQTTFSLAGMGAGANCLVRIAFRYTPDVDDSDMDIRLNFTTNTATQGTGLTNFSIDKQALVVTQGADEVYPGEILIPFFVGSTLTGTTIANAGKFSIEVNPSDEGDLEVLAVTVAVDN